MKWQKTAAHHKQMEDLMTAEALWKPVKYRQLQSVEDTADGVNDAAGQKPSEGCRRERCHQRLEDQNTGPAHGDIDNGAYPVWAVDDKYLKSDADKSGRPDEKGEAGYRCFSAEPAGRPACRNRQ